VQLLSNAKCACKFVPATEGSELMLTGEDQRVNAREPENCSLKADEGDSWKNEPPFARLLRHRPTTPYWMPFSVLHEQVAPNRS